MAGAVAAIVVAGGRGIRAGLGIVARVGPEWRTGGGGRVERWLETDLPLRPGLSGGPVLDARGKAMGLLTGGLLRGHALALPPETLRRVVGSILAHGSVRRGFLGIATVPVVMPIGSSTPPPQSMVPAAIISVSICDGVRLAM